MPKDMHKQLTDEAVLSCDKTPKIKYNKPLDKIENLTHRFLL